VATAQAEAAAGASCLEKTAAEATDRTAEATRPPRRDAAAERSAAEALLVAAAAVLVAAEAAEQPPPSQAAAEAALEAAAEAAWEPAASVEAGASPISVVLQEAQVVLAGRPVVLV
jgi:hypothetical protein